MADTADKKIKILLIDDDHFLLDMYLLKFKSAGMTVDLANNSMAALEKLRSGNAYDVVLVDIIMPGMDGLEFIQTVRKEKLSPEGVFIMLTNETESVGKATAIGVDGYIVKATMTPSEVVEEVMKIYNKKHTS